MVCIVEPNAQQLANWTAYSWAWDNKISKNVHKYILTAEIARDFQTWLDTHGVMFPTVWTSQDQTNANKIIDVFNRIDRANDKVEQGVYGLKFTEWKLDIIAPLDMPQEEYQSDIVTGFGLHPLIWVGVIGAVVVGSIVATSHLLDSIAKNETAKTSTKIVESAKEIANMSPEMQAALARLIEANKEKLQQAGLLDKLLGGGSGLMIAGAIAIGVIIYAYTRSK